MYRFARSFRYLRNVNSLSKTFIFRCKSSKEELMAVSWILSHNPSYKLSNPHPEYYQFEINYEICNKTLRRDIWSDKNENYKYQYGNKYFSSIYRPTECIYEKLGYLTFPLMTHMELVGLKKLQNIELISKTFYVKNSQPLKQIPGFPDVPYCFEDIPNDCFCVTPKFLEMFVY